MRTDTAQPVRLSEYRAPDYLIDHVDLDIRLHLSATHVRARLSSRPNPLGRPGAPLTLDGDGLSATTVLLDGGALDLGVIAMSGLAGQAAGPKLAAQVKDPWVERTRPLGAGRSKRHNLPLSRRI